MISRRITFADLTVVAGLDRHRLRNLLRDIPEFAEREGRARVAREYSRHDLAVVAVCCELDRMGLRKDAIAGWVPEIKRALLGPRSVAGNPELLLSCNPAQAIFADGQARGGAGVVVALKPIFERVDAHCVGADLGDEQQRELEFGPTGVAVTNSKGRASGCSKARGNE